MVVDFQGHDKKETSQKTVNSRTEKYVDLSRKRIHGTNGSYISLHENHKGQRNLAKYIIDGWYLDVPGS